MVDYGRPLRFGIGIDSAAAGFEPSLDLARQADNMGLDYLAVPDRPFRPADLDAWTLLTYLLAQTEWISVVPDVANLRLRPPAMLAKAAASLAAMADGRVQLGVGAGLPPAPAAALAAPGEAGLDAGDPVAFTEEAVAVLRRVLRGEAVTADSADPARHRASGRVAGPTPPDPVEIWIGAAKPRMLALVGRTGEGWVCPMNVDVPPQEAARGHALIDVAARAAGRDPGEVRRIYNVLGSVDSSRQSRGLAGTVNVWIDALSRWALGMGFDTFVFWPEGDQTAQLKLFADEVVPGVRDRVAELREHPVTRVA